MGTCIAFTEHKDGKCNSSRVQVFEQDDGSLNGYCFACDTFVPDPMGDGVKASDIPKSKRIDKSPEDIAAEMEEIGNLTAVDLPTRMIRAKSLDLYGVKVGVSTKDGKTPAYVFFPRYRKGVLVSYKVRLLDPKKMWSVGDGKDVDMFGWELAKASGAKRLIITEGEFDAIALAKLLEVYTPEKYKEYIPAVISLPNGSASCRRDLARCMPEIRKFFNEGDISFCFDQDDAGAAALKAAMLICGKATSITLPRKDANQCVLDKVGKAAVKCITFQAETPKTSRLIWGRDVHDAARIPAVMGLSWPWPHMTELTRGMRYGETTYIAAGEKMGKSEVVNALAAHFAVVHNLKVMLAKPEESNNKTYKLIASKVEGKVFHDPKVEFDYAAYDRSGAKIMDNVCMLNLYQHISWMGLKEDIASAAAQGVKIVFIDPITNLTNGMSTGEANEVLQGIAQELAAMALDLDIHILIFCHLNKREKGATPWDRGAEITTGYFAGSSGMARSCNYAWGLRGNKDKELTPEERNMRYLDLLADREFGEVGSVPLYWDKATHLFTEAMGE